MKDISNDRRRRSMVWCSTPKCVHGAEYRIPVSGKLLCKHCASLLGRAELTRLQEAA